MKSGVTLLEGKLKNGKVSYFQTHFTLDKCFIQTAPKSAWQSHCHWHAGMSNLACKLDQIDPKFGQIWACLKYNFHTFWLNKLILKSPRFISFWAKSDNQDPDDMLLCSNRFQRYISFTWFQCLWDAYVLECIINVNHFRVSAHWWCAWEDLLSTPDYHSTDDWDSYPTLTNPRVNSKRYSIKMLFAFLCRFYVNFLWIRIWVFI